MSAAELEHAHFSSCNALDGLELLTAQFVEHRYASHAHSTYAIAVLESGAERYRYRGAEHIVSVGEMALLNPDELHTGHKACDSGWRYRVFYPRVEQFQQLLSELQLPCDGTPFLRGSVHRNGKLAQAMLALHRLLQDPFVSQLQRQSCWREVMLQLLQGYAGIAPGDFRRRETTAVRRAKELLAARLGDPPTLQELAAAVKLSPFHFLRVFRHAVGMPPHAWLLQRRLEQARALLRDGHAPLHVSLQLGFADQSHLGRQFKQAYGVAPGKYRQDCARSFKTDA